MFLVPTIDLYMKTVFFFLLKVTQYKIQIYKLCEQRGKKKPEEVMWEKTLVSLSKPRLN